MRVLMLLVALSAVSCESLNVSGVRIGAGLSDFRASAKAQVGEQKFTSTDPGDTRNVSVEIVHDVDDRTDAGLRVNVGSGEIGEVDTTTVDLEGVFRRYVLDGDIRPYLTGSVGYRRAEVDDYLFGSAHAHMFTVGAGGGLRVDLNRSVHLFAEIVYQGAFGEDFTTHGPAGFIGGGVTF